MIAKYTTIFPIMHNSSQKMIYEKLQDMSDS